jgi:ABC-type Zn uptake system ZnuABC Zn-binding protein ZnuA
MDGKLMMKLLRTELEERLNDPHSCLESAEYDQHVMISPKYLGRIAEGIREQLNAKLNFYSDE